MKRGIALVLVTMLLGQPAFALSCLAPSLTRDYKSAAQSEDAYIVVLGQLFFDASHFPKRLDRTNPPRDGVEIPAWFKGHSLTPQGFIRRFERDVTLRLSCAGPWCGKTEPGHHLAFLKKDGARFIMPLNPCGGKVYKDPSQEQVEQAAACMRGQRCNQN